MSDLNSDNSGLSWSLANLQKINVHELYARQRQSLRPWFEFFHTNKFKTPNNITTASRRLLANIEYFQTNYVVVIIILSVYCIITMPTLLFVLLAMATGCYLVNIKNREKPLIIMGRQIPLSQQYMGVFSLAIPLLIIVGAGSAIFWILGASVFIIVLHAAFHLTPNQDAFGLQIEEV